MSFFHQYIAHCTNWAQKSTNTSILFIFFCVTYYFPQGHPKEKCIYLVTGFYCDMTSVAQVTVFYVNPTTSPFCQKRYGSEIRRRLIPKIVAYLSLLFWSHAHRSDHANLIVTTYVNLNLVQPRVVLLTVGFHHATI